MAHRIPRLLGGAALAISLLVGVASPAAAAPDKAKGTGPATAESAPAADQAGSNDKAANDPHKPAPAKAQPAPAPAPTKPAPAPASSNPSKPTTTKSSTSSKTQGCDQTPYGNPGNGANHGGVYDDTCDGSSSKNGNGGGGANGKPCAGCVGSADEKNPKGQQPGPRDHNNGYECDGNNGIAKTNPAHTGCATATTPPCVPSAEDPCEPPCVPSADDPCEPPCVPSADDPCEPPCVPSAEDPCEPPCVPSADDPCEPPCVPTEEDPCTNPQCVPTAENPCAKVLDRQLTRTHGGGGDPTDTRVLGATASRGAAGLPVTGFGLTPVLFGAVLLALGALLVAVTRRRRITT